MKIVRQPRRPPATQFKAIREQVRKRLVRVADEHVKRREDVVTDWQPVHKPIFAHRIGVGTKQIFIQILIKNGRKSLGKYGGTVRDLWRWFNEGTKPHPIFPRFRKVLSWVNEQGVRVFRAFVPRHPGTKGTGDEAKINRDLRKRFDNAVDAGYRAGFKELDK